MGMGIFNWEDINHGVKTDMASGGASFMPVSDIAGITESFKLTPEMMIFGGGVLLLGAAIIAKAVRKK